MPGGGNWQEKLEDATRNNFYTHRHDNPLLSLFLLAGRELPQVSLALPSPEWLERSFSFFGVIPISRVDRVPFFTFLDEATLFSIRSPSRIQALSITSR